MLISLQTEAKHLCMHSPVDKVATIVEEEDIIRSSEDVQQQ